MNRRRPTLLAALTLTAAAALTLSACGSDDDGAAKDSDKIAGADTGSETSAAPSPSETDTAGRPKITFPSDAKNVFEYEKTGNATKDAALADSTLSVNSVDEAIFEGSTDTKALGFYNAESALSDSITYVLGYINKNHTWVGETRYFDYKVSLSGELEAYVTYCSDESKSFIKDKKTGKVKDTPTTADSYVLYHAKLAKNAQGVWQTTDIASTRGSKECQP
ncbi:MULTISPECIES: lipoprotein [Streptomyces]|uniref:Lipoprotein n=1 Tax=Streptomyces coelicolor (strain ATCC BAA-471 / A3(2) / M145) TaxID=100226 RepID=Q9KY80_STRCO|nr:MULTISPECIES: lipoprotein [Streptomyces]MYU44544.1 lipoprotein [Streptomyces sp. SID7813]MDX2928094.1 lipoprotein [Streptomyces sp. NRRL_B-16638]NSL77994.1 lipoprotein [Streptomyces coelicolor]QFI44925.1 lipoprotein [Streptomyces coelicolor A3(2)]QKN68541.1 lipoprotein [Streptomyces coelicolor]